MKGVFSLIVIFAIIFCSFDQSDAGLFKGRFKKIKEKLKSTLHRERKLPVLKNFQKRFNEAKLKSSDKLTDLSDFEDFGSLDMLNESPETLADIRSLRFCIKENRGSTNQTVKQCFMVEIEKLTECIMINKGKLLDQSFCLVKFMNRYDNSAVRDAPAPGLEDVENIGNDPSDMENLGSIRTIWQCIRANRGNLTARIRCLRDPVQVLRACVKSNRRNITQQFKCLRTFLFNYTDPNTVKSTLMALPDFENENIEDIEDANKVSETLTSGTMLQSNGLGDLENIQSLRACLQLNKRNFTGKIACVRLEIMNIRTCSRDAKGNFSARIKCFTSFFRKDSTLRGGHQEFDEAKLANQEKKFQPLFKSFYGLTDVLEKHVEISRSKRSLADQVEKNSELNSELSIDKITHVAKGLEKEITKKNID